MAPLKRQNGLAQGARLQYDALVRAGIDARLIDSSAATPADTFRQVNHAPASTYIFHSAGPETALLANRVLPSAAHAWRVGYWAWELPDPPVDWDGAEKLISEVWTPSRFSAESLGKNFRLPIKVVPHRVPVQPARRREFDAPFVVLIMADSRSSFSRKNPIGAVRAFARCLGKNPNAILIVKLGGRPEQMAAIESEVKKIPNARVVTDHLNDRDLQELYRSADVFLSLHRAEGFGLPMLEAMAHGVPVVGTGWSGNMEFMSEFNSALVPYEIVPVQDEAGIYEHKSVWAEPDVETAAAILWELYNNPSLYKSIAQAARESVSSFELAGDNVFEQ